MCLLALVCANEKRYLLTLISKSRIAVEIFTIANMLTDLQIIKLICVSRGLPSRASTGPGFEIHLERILTGPGNLKQ